MKRRLMLIAAIFLIVMTMTACSRSLSALFDENEVREEAAGIVKALNDGDYDGVCANMTAEMYAVLPEETLRETFDDLFSHMGEYVETTGFAAYSQTDDNNIEYAVAVLVAVYENGRITYTISFDTNMKLAGLYVK